MAYDPNQSGGGAAQALGDETANENESQQEDAGENTFFIPADSLPSGKEYKQGDKITLEVMGKDQDGDLEVCFPGSEGGDWRDELKSKLTEAGSPSGQGGMA